MNEFFFNPQRTTARISNGHHHRQKFRLIGKGGFRSAFLFHEFDGTRRVLKTLLYRNDRSFTPRTMDRMRRDAVASEQLTSSKCIVDIYNYCGMSALVDYSDSDDMLSLFNKKKKPEKDELFQIAHDVAQSVADAHHFNEEGRATIVHMDIKPNQWIKFDGRYLLNDFNVAKFLSWNPKTKQNCKLASGYSEGRVSTIHRMLILCMYLEYSQ
jgi:serine/threonine protein kinase